jgi:hypothetical protein
VLAVHWVRVRSSLPTSPARDGFEKFPAGEYYPSAPCVGTLNESLQGIKI